LTLGEQPNINVDKQNSICGIVCLCNHIVIKLSLTFGGMCMLPQHRGGACFCTRGAMQGYDVVLFIIALAKTVTPAGGPRREPGRAVAPATKPPL